MLSPQQRRFSDTWMMKLPSFKNKTDDREKFPVFSLILISAARKETLPEGILSCQKLANEQGLKFLNISQDCAIHHLIHILLFVSNYRIDKVKKKKKQHTNKKEEKTHQPNPKQNTCLKGCFKTRC